MYLGACAGEPTPAPLGGTHPPFGWRTYWG